MEGYDTDRGRSAMAAHSDRAVRRQIDRLFQGGSGAGLPEWQLLERYLDRRDETAFEAIVARHGPMVLGVCRRVLDDPHAAEDAFQATFLVLVRKARTLGARDAIGHWLYGVAHRVAVRARADAVRRRARERDGAAAAAPVPAEEPGRSALAAVLDDELSKLPARYRAPIVLCYLEGLTHEAAADRLGWPVGTVKGRLSRARDLLRSRLTRRGVAPAAAALTAALGRQASAEPSDALIAATIRAASRAGTAGVTGGLVSTAAVRLTDGVLSTMFLTKLKVAAAAGVSLGGLLLGAWGLAQPTGGHGAHQPTPSQRGTTATGGVADAATSQGKGGMMMTVGGREAANAKEQGLTAALDRLLPLRLSDEPLETALKRVKEAVANQPGFRAAELPVVVDPAGLAEAGATMQSRVSVLTDNLPLRASLDEMLRPLKLAATTRDGVLVISSRQEIALAEVRKLADQLRALGSGARDDRGERSGLSPVALLKRLPGAPFVYHSEGSPHDPTGGGDARTKAILAALATEVPMHFGQETPLEDVLEYVRDQTVSETLPRGIPIYVDPVGLEETEKTLASTVRIDVTDIPLRVTLRLVIKQLGLVYSVGNGILTITSAGSEGPTTPILTLAEMAGRGELTVEEMKQVVEMFRLRAQVERYASGDTGGADDAADRPDDHSTDKAIHAALDKTVDLDVPNETVSKAVRLVQRLTVVPELPDGVPIYIDPCPIAETCVKISLKRVKLRTGLRLLLSQVGMAYNVVDGLLIVAPQRSPVLSPGGTGGFQ
jgi:RNA polymerase sigma factor (sigma-70 family)